jgi:poly(beta-D-mannuronate) lyase
MTRRLGLFCLCVAITLAVSGQRLRSPWDDATIAPTDAPYACPAPPAFSQILHGVQGYTTDKQYSVIDPRALAAFNEATAGPTHLGQYATNAADAWRTKGSRAAAACVYSLLTAAAQADAWAGKMPDNNGVYMQNWMLSGTAIAYLKVRDSHAGTPAEDAAIQAWFGRVAGRVRESFENSSGHPGSDAWNNHMTWAGLALAAQGVANNDSEALLWGIEAYRLGVDAVQPDGSLPAEMGRGQLALHYQLYALGPLVMIAELTRSNGLDLYAQQNGAIHRLVAFDLAAMKDPSIIAQRAGAQKIAPPYSGLEIGWAVPWVRRFPDAQLSAFIAQAPWLRFWQWGGDPPDPANPPPPLSPGEAASVRRTGERLAAGLAQDFSPVPAHPPFLGAWCVQGDLAAHASIRLESGLLVLTNASGETSIGEIPAPDTLLAPAWHGTGGALTPGSSQIDWTNGTYWARCIEQPAARLHLAGTWIPMGVRSIVSTIRQEGHTLHIDNGLGATATGTLDGNGHLSTDWSGETIDGAVTPDGNHIHWSNQTWWTRAAMYAPGIH